MGVTSAWWSIAAGIPEFVERILNSKKKSKLL
jgi:hypothetical protein